MSSAFSLQLQCIVMPTLIQLLLRVFPQQSTSGSVLIIVVENKLVFGQEGF